MLGTALQFLQAGVKAGKVNGHGRRNEDFIVGGLLHFVLLGVHQQLLIQLFAGTQAGNLDLHVHPRLIAVETDEA